jgi:hypothetical protein
MCLLCIYKFYKVSAIILYHSLVSLRLMHYNTHEPADSSSLLYYIFYALQLSRYIQKLLNAYVQVL